MRRPLLYLTLTALLLAMPSAAGAARTVMDNGLTVVTDPQPGRIAAIKLFIRSPHAVGRERLVFALAARTLMNGTARLDAESFHAVLEENGIEMSSESSDDYALITVRSLPEDLPVAMDLLCQVLTEPRVDEDTLRHEAELYCRSLDAQRDQPFQAGLEEIYRRTYGYHPYAPAGGDAAELLKGLDAAEVKACLKRWYRPERSVISLCGCPEPLETAAAVSRGWGTAAAVPSAETARAAWPRLRSASGGIHRVYAPLQGEWIFTARELPSMNSPDYLPLKILDTVIGGGMDSRLFDELRERRNLAYEVASFYPSRMLTSRMVAYLGTSPQHSAEAADALENVLDEVRRRGITEEERARAVAYLAGLMSMAGQRTEDRAFYRGWFEMAGLGWDFFDRYPESIRKISLRRVNEAARRWLRGDLTVILGPGSSGGGR